MPTYPEAYRSFHAEFLAALKRERPGITTATATRSGNYFDFSAGKSGLKFGWDFASRQNKFRVTLWIDTGDRDWNDELLKELKSQRASIEGQLRFPIVWEDMVDGDRARRVAVYAPFAVDVFSPDATRLRLKQWFVPTIREFVDAFGPAIRSLG